VPARIADGCLLAAHPCVCRQAAEITCQTIAQYLDKYAEEFSLRTADRFFHKAFCLAHQVSPLALYVGIVCMVSACLSAYILLVCQLVRYSFRFLRV